MPEYFEGASDIYYNDAEVMGWRFKNKYKFPVSEKVKKHCTGQLYPRS